MHSIFDLLTLLSSHLFLAKRSPGCHSLFAVLLPGLHILLNDLLRCSLLLLLMPLLPLTSGLKTLEEILTLLYLFEELLAHVLDLKVECLFGQ